MRRVFIALAAAAVLAAAVVVGVRDPIREFVFLWSLAVVVGVVALYGAVYHGLMFLARRSRSGGIRDALRDRPRAVRVATHVSIPFFLLAAFTVNRVWLPDKLHPISLVVDVVVVAATVLVWRLLLRPTFGRIAAVVFSAVVLALALTVSTMQRLSDAGASGPNTAALAALPYVAWTPGEADGELAGVVYYDEENAFPGFNLYTPQPTHTALLIDMEGNVVHEWDADYHGDDVWSHVEMLPGGDLLVAVSVHGTLLRLDWDSNVVWAEESRHYHHDVEIADNGDIYAIYRKAEVIARDGFPVPVVNDYIGVLAHDLRLKKELSLYRLFGGRVDFKTMVIDRYRWLMDPRSLYSLYKNPVLLSNPPIDLFHANTLSIIDRDIDDVFRTGQLLICSRTLSTIAVVDMERESLVWSWGDGELDWPHHPTLLDNDQLLIFDNGTHRGFSRVVQLDPTTEEVVWQYQTDPKEQFFSKFRGSSQRLPNGNTLVGDGQNGRAFEVTPEGEVVWEFYNPVINDAGSRSTFYRVIRLSDPDAYPVLRRVR